MHLNHFHVTLIDIFECNIIVFIDKNVWKVIND